MEFFRTKNADLFIPFMLWWGFETGRWCWLIGFVETYTLQVPEN